MIIHDTVDATRGGRRGFQGDDWGEDVKSESKDSIAPKIASYNLESLIAYYRKNAVGDNEKLFNTTAEYLFAYRELRSKLKAFNKDFKFADERESSNLIEAIKNAKEAADVIADKISKKVADVMKEEAAKNGEASSDSEESVV